jgi:predicted O-linked N-acetylglucosamine transferase (SPINDLY family)
MPPFHLAFHGCNDRDLLRDMALFLQRRSTLHASTAERLTAPRDEPRPPRRRRIGFISRHFSNHTVMSYFFRLILELGPRLPHCLLLEFPQKDNAFRRALAARLPLLTLPENLPAARDAVAAQQLDVLLFLDLGMDSLTWFLAFHRLAPVQCALYGHPATTGIAGVDIFLSPAPLEPPGAQAHYSETLVALPCLLSAFSLPDIPEKSPRRKRGFTQYLCPQNLCKAHPDMDAAVRRILREDASARCAFFVSSRKEETLALQKRLHLSLGEDFSRIDWLPQCSEQEFLTVLREADAVIDTPHFSGGATSYKALGAGVPVVTLEGEFMRGRQTAGLYRHMGFAGSEDCIAANLDDYCRLALDLAHSPARQAQLRASLLSCGEALLDPEPSVSLLADFLQQPTLKNK